ncbi:MAG: tryptophan synthase subunit beta [Nanobdellota archaeon]
MKEDFNEYFDEFGGAFVPEGLKSYLNEIAVNYQEIKGTKAFKEELDKLLKNYVGRPSPLYFAKKLSERLGFKVYLKREDLNHTGAHKINNTLGQALLAKHMGKTEVIAETGAGQHGVATATACSLLGMKCKVFMGSVDIKKQMMNVYRMRLLGAEVIEVSDGGKVLKDAVDAALAYLIENSHVYYLLGSVVGPHPYPTMVRDFQSIIGREAKAQIIREEGRLPDYLVACVGGGSNAMGLFSEFVNEDVNMVAVEPAGFGLETGKHAASLTLGKPGQIHGFKCYVLKNEDGEPADVYSIASGLDYPGVGPEPSMLKKIGRLDNVTITDKEALDAFHSLSENEGILPALESSHAIAHLEKMKKEVDKEAIVVVNLSGRGDKDVESVYNLEK